MVVGSQAAPAGPFTTAVPAGALLLLAGDHSRRRLLAATLGGRLDPISGRAQVGGHPLPSESSPVRRMVAMTEVSRPAHGITVGQLLDERMRLTRPRGRRGAIQVESWVRSINSALADVGAAAPCVEAATPMAALTALESATVLVAAAVAEGAPVVAIDQPDDFAATDQLIMAAVLLAHSRATIIAGVPGLDSRAINVGRHVVTIEVDTLDSASHGASHGASRHSAALDRREVLQ